ncbi:MAG: hypothetical protein JWM84_4031 [Nocardioides sp.]|nr:hypothetical protein [Nocardioides sp.]
MDRREAILARLLEIAAAIPGIVLAARNRPDFSDRARPAILILDADETADDREKGRGRAANAPNLVGMTPEIHVLLGGKHEQIGTQINALRVLLLKAVLTDEALRTIVGPNGEIRYEACATDLAAGRAVEGNLGVSFTFTYPLIPSEL